MAQKAIATTVADECPSPQGFLGISLSREEGGKKFLIHETCPERTRVMITGTSSENERLQISFKPKGTSLAGWATGT